METLLKADVFFFVTASAVILLAILGTVAIIYVLKILNDVRFISSRLRSGVDLLTKDAGFIRKIALHELKKLKMLLSIFGEGEKPKRKRSSRKK